MTQHTHYADDAQRFWGSRPFVVDGPEAMQAIWAAGFRAFPTRRLELYHRSVRVYEDKCAVGTGYWRWAGVNAKGAATIQNGRYSNALVKIGGLPQRDRAAVG